jgi:hypothetical protein
MIDDVVGLVMVQVVSNLGKAETDISAATVIRPILVSLGFAVITPLVCRFAIKPLTGALNKRRESDPTGWLHKLFCKKKWVFVIETLILFGLTSASSYSGSSNLFASYIAGAAISWWDSEIPHVDAQIASLKNMKEGKGAQTDLSVLRPEQNDSPSVVAQSPKEHFTSLDVFHAYYHQPLERVLKPLFFVRRLLFFHTHSIMILTNIRHRSVSQSRSLKCFAGPLFGGESFTQPSWFLAN